MVHEFLVFSFGITLVRLTQINNIIVTVSSHTPLGDNADLKQKLNTRFTISVTTFTSKQQYTFDNNNPLTI